MSYVDVESLASEGTPETALLAEEALILWSRAVRSQIPDWQDLIRLRASGLTYRQLAKEFEVSEQRIRRVLERVHRKMRAKLVGRLEVEFSDIRPSFLCEYDL